MNRRTILGLMAGLLGSAFLGSIVGCGGSAPADKPPLVKAGGRIVTPQGQPLADALIEFTPVKGAPSSARSDSEGRFVLMYGDGTPGAALGTHQVRVTVGGSPMGGGGETKPLGNPTPPTLYLLPPVTIEAETNTLELRQPEKGQPG